MQKVIYSSQIKDYSDYLNADIIEYLGHGLTDSFEGFDTFDLIGFKWYDASGADAQISRIIIYIDHEDLFFLCKDKKSYDKCNALLSDSKTNERALYLFFVALLAQDAKRLEEYETQITAAEDAALKNSRTDYLDQIRVFRKKILRLKQYYEELDTITDHLIANDNDLFSKDGVRHFSIVHNRVNHFCANVMSLRDYVTQMREACQSQIDIEQNKLMKVFTVVATIFLPLTLVAGWYGMNFKYMPELEWQYGYFYVIGLSILVSVLLIIWFKHKKWI